MSDVTKQKSLSVSANMAPNVDIEKKVNFLHPQLRSFGGNYENISHLFCYKIYVDVIYATTKRNGKRISVFIFSCWLISFFR